MAGKLWTKEEIEILINKSPTLTLDDLNKLLPLRKNNGISTKLKELGLTFIKKTKRTPIEEIYNFITNNNLEFIQWVNTYTGNTSKIKCKCLLHNEDFITSIVKLTKENVRCKQCMVEKVQKNKALDKNIVYNDFINSGYEIVQGEYFNSYSRFVLKCPNDHLWETDYHNFKHKGRNCIHCHYINNHGETSNHWKGGITPLHNYLRNNIEQWKRDSMLNCNYKCIITGNKFTDIHHLYSFHKILKETIKESKLQIYQNINDYTKKELQQLTDKCLEIHYRYPLGVCLSSEIHNLFHNLYSILDNTPEQFAEFKQRYLSGEFNLKEVSNL